MGRALLASNSKGEAGAARAAAPVVQLLSAAVVPMQALPSVVITELAPVNDAPPAHAPAAEPPSATDTQPIRRSVARPSGTRFLWAMIACLIAIGAIAAWGIQPSSQGLPAGAAAHQGLTGREGPAAPIALTPAATPAPEAEPASAEGCRLEPEQALAGGGAPITGAAQTASDSGPGAAPAATPPVAGAFSGRKGPTRGARRPPPTRVAMDMDSSTPRAAETGHQQPPALSGRIFGDEEEQ